MLVLSMLKGEKIYLDDGAVEVHFLEAKGGRIYLGFYAPKEMRIDREVVFRKRLANGQQKRDLRLCKT